MIESLWPDQAKLSRTDRLLHRIGKYPGFCPVCGSWTRFVVDDPNFREHVPCGSCGAVNRYRQMAVVLLRLIDPKRRLFPSLRDIPRNLVIWNTETTRALHATLAAHLGANYIASEFVDPALPSGKSVDGVLHVDMQRTHFADESLDYILSSDVVEHIPFYLDAMRETYRVLKYGGAHVFTAPFYHHRFTVERRSEMKSDGSIEHRFKPWYHGDPLRPEGVLCFNVFAPELLVELESIGFQAELLRVHDPLRGILGFNGIVMVARKVKNPDHRRDVILGD
jgi:SAM-dependent methyltransferase